MTNNQTCSECGGTNHIFNRHKEHCSQFKHIIDDHYDSACMRGHCKYCYPDQEQCNTYVLLNDKEIEIIEMIRKDPRIIERLRMNG